MAAFPPSAQSSGTCGSQAKPNEIPGSGSGSASHVTKAAGLIGFGPAMPVPRQLCGLIGPSNCRVGLLYPPYFRVQPQPQSIHGPHRSMEGFKVFPWIDSTRTHGLIYFTLSPVLDFSILPLHPDSIQLGPFRVSVSGPPGLLTCNPRGSECMKYGFRGKTLGSMFSCLHSPTAPKRLPMAAAPTNAAAARPLAARRELRARPLSDLVAVLTPLPTALTALRMEPGLLDDARMIKN